MVRLYQHLTVIICRRISWIMSPHDLRQLLQGHQKSPSPWQSGLCRATAVLFIVSERACQASIFGHLRFLFINKWICFSLASCAFFISIIPPWSTVPVTYSNRHVIQFCCINTCEDVCMRKAFHKGMGEFYKCFVEDGGEGGNWQLIYLCMSTLFS